MRVLINVDPDWRVTVTIPSRGGQRERIREMRRRPCGTAGDFPAPPQAAGHDGGTSLAASDDQLVDAYTRITSRDPLAPVPEFGRYLFDCLLGEALWREICEVAVEEQARTIELALCWASSEQQLHRLNWEMMHSGERFLAAGVGRASVATTRLVAGVQATAPQLGSPPRVLFIIGSSLNDPRIRPGAEYLGLLRQLKRRGRGIHPRLLENATPRRIKEVMAAFRPEIVYFVCHGYLDPIDGRGYLELAVEEDSGEVDRRRYADQLLEYLEVDGAYPSIVVLSTCLSAAGSSGISSRMLGAHETAPLAAELVQGNVPIVLGMAGRVSDLACRLFTRRFGESLVQGLSLVAATADARRATFAEANPPHRSTDWALPAVFMADAVDPDYTPVDPRDDDLAARIADLIVAYKVERSPVFCSRDAFFQAYYELFDDRRVGVLAAFVAHGTPGFGRTRLLQELTMQAIRDGNVPILISPVSGQRPPRTVEELGGELLEGIMTVRELLGLDVPLDSQLLFLKQMGRTGAPPLAGLDEYIASYVERRGVTAQAIRRAMKLDLAALARDARAAHEPIRRANGRVVVLLDEVDQYDHAVVSLFDELLDGFGLGTAEEPVPVVLTFSLGGTMDHFLRAVVVERGITRTWLDVRELTGFLEDGEDLMAYELVLLNPFNPGLLPGLSDRSWAFNPEAEEELRARWVSRFRRNLGGVPSALTDRVLYALVDAARDADFVVEADDEIRLARLQGDE